MMLRMTAGGDAALEIAGGDAAHEMTGRVKPCFWDTVS
jgi:hypothetical protein